MLVKGGGVVFSDYEPRRPTRAIWGSGGTVDAGLLNRSRGTPLYRFKSYMPHANRITVLIAGRKIRPRAVCW